MAGQNANKPQTALLSYITILSLILVSCTLFSPGEPPGIEEEPPRTPAQALAQKRTEPDDASAMQTPTRARNSTQAVIPEIASTRTLPPTLNIPSASLDENSLNPVNNGEIIEEMTYFGFGGGGGGGACQSMQTKPVFDAPVTAGVILKPVSLSSCGWQPGEMIQVRMRDPLGKTITFQEQAVTFPGSENTSGWLDIDYQPPLGAATGVYRFSFEGQNGKLETAVNFAPNPGAHMAALSGDPFHAIWSLPKGSQHRLLLFGFQPRESVRLLVYLEELNQFYGYQDFSMDAQGNLQINVDLRDIEPDERVFFMAYGQKSGSVPLAYWDYLHDMEALWKGYDFYCPGAAPTRIKVNGYRLRAAHTDGSNLRIRKSPGFNAAVLAAVPEGTEMEYTGRTICADNTFWWQVYPPGEDTTLGWAAETYQGKYILEYVDWP